MTTIFKAITPYLIIFGLGVCSAFIFFVVIAGEANGFFRYAPMLILNPVSLVAGIAAMIAAWLVRKPYSQALQ